jgi:hypothetical protein
MNNKDTIPAGHADFENTLTPEQAEEFDRMAAEQIAKQKVYVPPTITGYRQLTDAEIALVNEAKALAQQCGAFIGKLRAPIPDGQTPTGTGALDQRWVSIGATDLQRGFMAVIRGIAQPTTF